MASLQRAVADLQDRIAVLEAALAKLEAVHQEPVSAMAPAPASKRTAVRRTPFNTAKD